MLSASEQEGFGPPGGSHEYFTILLRNLCPGIEVESSHSASIPLITGSSAWFVLISQVLSVILAVLAVSNVRRNLRVISGRFASGTQNRRSVIKAAGMLFLLFFFFTASPTKKKTLWKRAKRRGFEGRVAFQVLKLDLLRQS